MNLARFARRGYVQEATPLEFLPAFSKALGNKANIWIKRCPARAAATRPASWISPLPTPWPRARTPSSPAGPCSPTIAA